jgi:DNA mismatch repair protein MutS
MPPEGATPIRRQYLEIKRRYPQAIVFFRLGDFYETFDDDAKLVAKELDITLTSKPMGKDLRVPLAGIPHHSLDAHLKKLVGRGFKVAICEQMEDPRKAKGIVQREVVRVVTPGTVLEESLVPSGANNYLVALATAPPARASRGVDAEASLGVASVDITTGEFAVTEVTERDLPAELARIAPAEVILSEGADIAFDLDCPVTRLDRRLFLQEEGERLLKTHLGVSSLDGFGLRGLGGAVAAAGAALAYLLDNQKAAVANLRDLRPYSADAFMALDASARRHLEIFSTARDGSRRGSLIDVIDCARTAMGSRLLNAWLGRPLLDPEAINARLDRVQHFFGEGLRRGRVRECLSQMADLERIVGRLVAGLASPRDLVALRGGLVALPGLLAAAGEPAADSQGLAGILRASGEVAALIAAAVRDDPAPAPGEGGVIREGFSPELDDARALTGDARKAIAELEAVERERTGIRSLRVAYNRVFGYYIEVSNTNLDLVPPDFQRKQTLVGAERFVTPALRELEERILEARENIGELESNLFRSICAQVAARAARIKEAAETVAEIDAVSALAETAARYGYARPDVDSSGRIEIRDGRHPVVERTAGEGRFVPNDAFLDPEDAQIVVLTGPNMAGKSTYLRQVALLVLLAQAGSFVPATAATIGVVDRIFTRIGAQDDLSRGESTFMVEMIETAAILRSATPRSLIVFDEVGRGTSTYDGLAIARSVVEYLHTRPERAAKTLFATHYHEMTALASTLGRVRNFNVAVAEQEGRVVFLHRIVPGGADRSYGVHVAELAGMPAPVVQRARDVLASLEQRPKARPRAGSDAQPALPLLAAPSEVEADLAALDLDSLTPLEALNKLYELRAKFQR